MAVEPPRQFGVLGEMLGIGEFDEPQSQPGVRGIGAPEPLVPAEVGKSRIDAHPRARTHQKRIGRRDQLGRSEVIVTHLRLRFGALHDFEFQQGRTTGHGLAPVPGVRFLGRALGPRLVVLLGLPFRVDEVAVVTGHGPQESKPRKPGCSSTACSRAANRFSNSGPAPSGTEIALIFTTAIPATVAGTGGCAPLSGCTGRGAGAPSRAARCRGTSPRRTRPAPRPRCVR